MTSECVRDVRVAMPRAACSAGIGRRHRCSHVTLTVTLAVYESFELDLKSKWWKEKQDR